MSKDKVTDFIKHMEKHGASVKLDLNEPDPEDVILHAERHGFTFTEEDLKSALNSRICNAESLPRPWGWALARKFGLVRS